MNEGNYIGKSPPKAALRFLQWFCPDHLYEEIEGDLIQKFQRDLKVSDTSKVSGAFALQRARRRFVWNVIRFFRPGIVFRNRVLIKLTIGYMFKNYLKVAFRRLAGNKVFSGINVVGLALG